MLSHRSDSPLRLFWLILLGYWLGFALVGCDLLPLPPIEPTLSASPSPSPTPRVAISPTPTQAALSGTVSIWHSWQDTRLPALLRQIADFRQEHPGVQFDVTYVPSIDLRNSYQQAALDGSAPGVLIAPADWGPDYYEQRLIADLSSLADADLLSSLNAAAVESARYRDAQIGLPLHIEGIVLYRNAAIIPEPPATFDELVAAARDATRGTTVGAMLERGFAYSGGHLHGLGGTWMNPDGSPAFNNQLGLAWLALLGSFEQAGPTDYLTDADVALFKEQRLGMMVEGTWLRDELAEAIGNARLTIDPWPLYANGTLSGFVRAENVYLSQRASEEQRQLYWSFIRSLFTPESQASLAQVSLIPAIDPLQLTSEPGVARIEDSLISQAMLALRGGAPYPAAPWMAFYLPHMEVAIQSVMNGEAAPAQALQQAHDAILADLAARKATPQP